MLLDEIREITRQHDNKIRKDISDKIKERANEGYSSCVFKLDEIDEHDLCLLRRQGFKTKHKNEYNGFLEIFPTLVGWIIEW